MADRQSKANFFHYVSSRYRRAARRLMEAKLHALVTGFDFTFVIADMLQEIIGIIPVIEELLDSRTLFEVIATDGKTA